MNTYYQLTKPGIIYGNAMTAAAAFFFASQHIDIPQFIAMLAGLCLSIACGCVINNVMDRDIDTRMQRTAKRSIATGVVPVRNALIFALLLGAAGLSILFFFTNLLAFLVTLFGVFVYLVLYTPAKRTTVHSTIIGALAGAVPPVVGYTAVTNTLDTNALLLFLILVSWQMTHFFAIGIFRLADYTEADLPVMPVYAGIARTKIFMVVYSLVFALAAFALYVVNHLGPIYFIPVGALSAGWILISLTGFFTKNEARWARKTFFYSLILLMVFSLSIALS